MCDNYNVADLYSIQLRDIAYIHCVSISGGFFFWGGGGSDRPAVRKIWVNGCMTRLMVYNIDYCFIFICFSFFWIEIRQNCHEEGEAKGVCKKSLHVVGFETCLLPRS